MLGRPRRFALVRFSEISVVDVVGWAAVVVGLVGAWPQVLRMRRTGATDGVSWASAVMGVAAVMMWLAYGVAAQDPVQVVNNTLAMVAAVALCALLFAHARPKVLPAVAGLGASLVVLALVWALTGVVGVAAVASGLSIVRMVPQARLVARRGPLGGLCPWSTVLALTGSVLWLAYGVAVADVAVTVTSLAAAGLGALVAARRLPPRRTLRSLSNGRLGPAVSWLVTPVAARLA